MTGVDAIKLAVEDWWGWQDPYTEIVIPKYVNKLCHIIYKLKREVFNVKTGDWEYEGF